MIISHKYKFIFIKTKKTAGTSIEVYLSQFCGPEDIVTPIYPKVKNHYPKNFKGFFSPLKELTKGTKKGIYKNILIDFLKQQKYYNHIPSASVKNRIDLDIWNSYTKFCVERNPWEKTVSHYHMVNSRSEHKITFEEYLNSGNFCLNFPKYYDITKHELLVDHVLQYDKLNEELESLFNKIGIPFTGELSERAKSNYRNDKKHYSQYYNRESAALIERAFKTEIDLWNYKFEANE